MRMHYRFIEVDYRHQISTQTDCNLVFLIQRAVLLGMKEAGRLSEMQHRQAEATLLEQHREYIREQGESLKDD